MKKFFILLVFLFSIISLELVSLPSGNAVSAVWDRCEENECYCNDCSDECDNTCPSESPSPSIEVTPTPTDEPARGGNGGPVGAPVCNDTVPSTPSITSVVKLDSDSVKVSWGKVTPASDYAIMYGTKSGDYPYGVFSTGNTDNYTINGINGGCFAIKAINGCMPGNLSAEVCTGGGQVLGASTLGATGSFAVDMNLAGFALGFILGGIGVRKASIKKVQ